ncbi:hypothetical protein CKAH01_09742 [Colletotrichum kahawae]|uniref:Heterokaryon incompatibility domain-containing protein n=1 Tax=Colletotrichum kahawae TaxID=34407 RepID=A0AAD9XZ19_COLKA|nr:hypothetical protein CKAH01_09742 [Colletotrichum kahawae]
MEDDLGKTGLPPFGIEDIEKMKTFWRFTIMKASAHVWAFRQIRFLVYDDTDDEVNKDAISSTEECASYDSEDEEATLRKAIEMSLETEDVSQNQSPQHMKAGASTHKSPFATDHGLPDKCDICANLPEFPHDRKARNFRVINPGSLDPTRSLVELPPCTHYVAVSYCWPEPVFNELGQLCQAQRESKVRDLNGIVRDARALDDVLDRAVDFANFAGLRMIWIDQECLPPPAADGPEEEKEYQQMGIQAMDIVYNQALFTVGLLSGIISDQSQADALRILIDLYDNYDEHEPLPKLDFLILDELYSFLSLVISDRWYTRAWVVQESISAGERLALSFRRGKSIEFPSFFRSGINPTAHSLDTDFQGHRHSSQLINIYVDDFRGLLRVAERLVEEQFQE